MKNNLFSEEVIKIALNANDDKRMQSIDLRETYAYRTSKKLICKKDIKYKINIIKHILTFKTL